MEPAALSQYLEGVKVPFGTNAGVPLSQLSNDSLLAYFENEEIKAHYPRSHFLAGKLLESRGIALAARDAARGPEEAALLQAKAKEEEAASLEVSANEQKEIKEESPPADSAPSDQPKASPKKGK